MMDGKSWKHACQVYLAQVDDENRSIGMENPINYQSQKTAEGLIWNQRRHFWLSNLNKPENQDEDAPGKIEQQQDFVILNLTLPVLANESFWKSPWFLCINISKMSSDI